MPLVMDWIESVRNGRHYARLGSEALEYRKNLELLDMGGFVRSIDDEGFEVFDFVPVEDQKCRREIIVERLKQIEDMLPEDFYYYEVAM